MSDTVVISNSEKRVGKDRADRALLIEKAIKLLEIHLSIKGLNKMRRKKRWSTGNQQNLI
jgi:hypothetical protein